MRVWVIAIIGSLCVAQAALTAGQNPSGGRGSQPAVGTAVIEGTVVIAGSAVPLGGVSIVVSMEGQSRPYTATTDAAGRYGITSLPPARFTVTASRAGYIRLAYGQTRPAQGGRSVVLSEKQILRNINFALPRGGVIAGTVVDEQGQPVIGAVVSALRRVYKDGKPSVDAVVTGPGRITGVILSNDLGEFRVYGLEPGVFYVGALVADETATPPRLTPVFYAPGTPNVGEAARVTVGLGQTVSGVSIVIGSRRARTVSGVALGLDQQPMAGAIVELRRRASDAALASSPRTQLRADGRFAFTDVYPGEYDISAQQTRNGVASASIARVIVGDGDVPDVILTPVGTTTASGRVLVDAPGAVLPASALRVLFEPMNVDLPESQLLPIADVGTDFQFNARPFAIRSRVTAHVPAGSIVRAVRLRGQDVTDSGVEFRSGETLGDIEIEVTNRLTSLSGTVRIPSGQTPDDWTVLVFPKDPARRDGSERRFAVLRPDQNATFSVTGLAAGEYLAVALDYVDMNYAQDPQLLDRVAQLATSFTLADAETKALSLVLVGAP